MLIVTAREQLQLVVAGMSEVEAEQALALVNGARAGTTPVDVFGTAWGQVLDGADSAALAASGTSTIQIRPGMPRVA